MPRSGPFWPLTCGVQDAFLLSLSSSPPGSDSGSLCRGVRDALVGGISLPVDAVRVDLQQDRDAAPNPGPAADLGAGTPELSRRDTTPCRRSWDADPGALVRLDGS